MHRILCAIVLWLITCGAALSAEPAVDELIDQLLDPENRTYSKAGTALGAMGDRAVEPLAAHLDITDPNLRRRVIYALGKTKAAAAVPHIARVALDPERDVSSSALSCLSEFGDAGVEAVVQMAFDPDETVRKRAATFATHRWRLPIAPVKVVTIKPDVLQVDGGLVISSTGLIARPYRLHAAVVRRDGKWRRVFTVNDVVLTDREVRADRLEKEREQVAKELHRRAGSLARNGLWFQHGGHGYYGSGGVQMRRFLERIATTDLPEAERARALYGVLRVEIRMAEKVAVACVASILLKPDASAARRAALTKTVLTDVPRFHLNMYGDHFELQAANVSTKYCIAKVAHYLQVEMVAKPGLRDRVSNLTIRLRKADRDTFLTVFADRLTANVAKEGGRYVLSSVAGPPPPKLKPWPVRWSYEGTWTYLRTPALSGNKVILGAGHDELVALHAATGNVLWQTKVPHAFCGAHVVGDVAYVAGDDNDMHAVRLRDGHLLWSHQAPRPVVDYGGGMRGRPSHGVRFLGLFDDAALFRSGDGNIYALNCSDGKEAWRLKNPVDGAHAALSDRTLFFTSSAKACAFDPKTRRTLWLKDKDSLPGGPPFVTGGRILIAGKGKVVALSGKDGTLKWRTDTGRKGGTSVVRGLTRGPLVVLGGYGDNHVYGLDRKDGRILWRTNVDGFPTKAAAWRGTQVLVVTNAGTVCTIRVTDGRPLAERALGVTGMAAPRVAGPLILVPSLDKSKAGRYGRGVGVLTANNAGGDAKPK